MDFVVAAANLYAQTYGIEGSIDREDIRTILHGFPVSAFTPKLNVKIPVEDKDLEKGRDGKREGFVCELRLWPFLHSYMYLFCLVGYDSVQSLFLMDVIVTFPNSLFLFHSLMW